MNKKRLLSITGIVLLWMVTVLIALSMMDAGYGKFESADGWKYWFEQWGYAAWFATVIGIAEIMGGALLLIPRTAPYAAALLIAIMLGAFYTVTTNESDLSWFDPLFNTVLLTIVLIGRWPGPLRRQTVTTPTQESTT